MKKLLKKIGFVSMVALIALGAYYGNDYERFALFFVSFMAVPICADCVFTNN